MDSASAPYIITVLLLKLEYCSNNMILPFQYCLQRKSLFRRTFMKTLNESLTSENICSLAIGR